MQDFVHCSESSILTLNRKAMELMHQGNMTEAFHVLNEAEKMLKSIPSNEQFWAITLNNYGCYYKKAGKLQEALSCFSQALTKERRAFADSTNLAGTHLNLSSIYASLGVHEVSLRHAVTALKTLQKSADKSLNALTTLIVAHHSAGLEYQALLRTLEAMHMYKKGWDLGKEHLGESHPLTLSLKKSLQVSSKTSRNSAIMPIRRSRGSAHQPQSSFTRISHRKPTTSMLPVHKQESFPSIKDYTIFKDHHSSLNYSEKPIKMRQALNPAEIISAFPDTAPERKRPLTFSKKKVQALQSIIDELESNVSYKRKQGDGRLSFEDFPEYRQVGKQDLSCSIGVQVELAEKMNRETHKKEPPIKGLNRNKRAEKKENLEVGKVLKEVGERKEVMPIPSRSKVEFYRHKDLHTIYEARYEEKLDAVIMIQSHIRAWRARKAYLLLRRAAINVQKTVKMQITKSLYKQVLNAATFIQAVFRGHRVRKLYKFLLKTTP